MSLPLFRLTDLDFSYPGQPVLLRGVDLTIREQERVLLTGDNGSGKTTLLKLLVGLLKPSSGQVLLSGEEPGRQSPELYRSLFFSQQNSVDNLFGLCPRHDLQVWQIAHPERLDSAGLETNDDTLARNWDRPFSALSAGELQALALLYLPRFLDKFWILDEPTAGLDAERKARFHALCQQKMGQSHGMLVVSHDPGLPASLFDRKLLLQDGQLMETSS